MSGTCCDNSTTQRYVVPSPIVGTLSVAASSMQINGGTYAAQLASSLSAPSTIPGSSNLQVLTNATSTIAAVRASLASIASAVTPAFEADVAPGTLVLAGVKSRDGNGLYSTFIQAEFVDSGGNTVTWTPGTLYEFHLSSNLENVVTGVAFKNNPYGSALTTTPSTPGNITGYITVIHVTGSLQITVAAPVIEGVNSVPPCPDNDPFPPESGCSNPESNEQYFGEDCYQFDNCPYA